MESKDLKMLGHLRTDVTYDMIYDITYDLKLLDI